MIYIDPPYNTGNDFIYNDNFRMTKEESDIAEGDVSDLGERYTVNRKDHNRYHTNWLNMMYPRLRVAKDLLKDDGVIFISIDDGEVANLRKVCDEVFGEENFVAGFIWKKRTGSNDSQNGVSNDHEYILCCFKSNRGLLAGVKKDFSNYKNPDNDLRGAWAVDNLTCNKTASERPNLYYPITDPNTGITYQCNPNRVWVYEQERMRRLILENKVIFPKNRNGTPTYKRHLSELRSETKPFSSLLDTKINSFATKELRTLIDGQFFNYPKSVDLIYQLIQQIISDESSVVLDFFSGSSTTAHAVMQLNAEDNGNRKYIMVQLPETCDENSEAFKAGYKNICEIGKERIRRAGKKILEENKEKEGIENLDVGFKVFRVGDTNINWLHQDLKGADIFDHYQKNASDKDKLDFTPQFTDFDVVYEIMLRQADIPLSCNVEKLSAIGGRTYIFADSFVVCLEQEITKELVDKLAAIEPLPIKFIFRDSAFDDDISLKDWTFRMLSALIDRNSGGEKQTYTVEFI
ncbi:MAG: site-specific DNA-methyltransferase [Desulfamplus sp.]|nr:site-specific DNA-methyltransferase [Desulfamplus sp.]